MYELENYITKKSKSLLALTHPVLQVVKYLCQKGECQPPAKYKSNVKLSMSKGWEDSFQSKRQRLSRRSKVKEADVAQW